MLQIEMRGRRRSWTDSDLITSVVDATSMAQVLRRLGLRTAGGNYEQIRTRMKALRLDTSHWTGQAHLRGKSNPHVPRRSLESILRRDVFYQSNKLRKRLIRERLLEPICSYCGGAEWLGRPIPLELDHVDGDKTNNQLENLRLICPNCHALTPTYRGKNAKYPHIPSAEKVREGIKRCGSIAAYAREMNVSSETARSWLLKSASK
jgi:5-methylcytosine-specific restriction endonuclease McrA